MNLFKTVLWLLFAFVLPVHAEECLDLKNNSDVIRCAEKKFGRPGAAPTQAAAKPAKHSKNPDGENRVVGAASTTAAPSARTAGAASATGQPRTADIDTLLVEMKSESLLQSVFTSMEAAMRQGMQQATAGRSMTAEQSRALESAVKRFTDVMRQDLAWEKFKPIVVDVYKDTFTQEEIDGLISFYRSPPGKAFVNKMPMVQQKTMVAVQGMMGPINKKMEAVMQQALREAKVAK